MKRLSLIITIAFVFTGIPSGFAQNTLHLDSYSRSGDKPFLFYLHTNWCIYCAMQNKVLKNKDIRQKVYEKYHFIDLNAESDIDIKWKEHVFKNAHPQKYTPHPFVIHLLGGQNIGYPAWIITDKDLNLKFVYPGFLKKKQLLKLLEFRQ
ncbi:hypothetical protein Pedsa_1987 [Pseudopedobacter saltans DSM 12145]|uniref:Thioredoxin domain-containing protein n=1 Tax=Pseudopedobacter saltans (strain ATCC 51119 / DSM 12145 / JCM 21818 / CCUG 39354 / LMG 10337 / NBRC 100064 / NCIMB 13643) TaxID=762903 RepID=F0S9Y2_PSESL|nr:thioredoxin fold domain-containing protein [Pseudopedobacter saltans]ADY52540.1 hypothetical protein Pedsa_1987 [Pseudopedobacter saltans DSM 12145]